MVGRMRIIIVINSVWHGIGYFWLCVDAIARCFSCCDCRAKCAAEMIIWMRTRTPQILQIQTIALHWEIKNGRQNKFLCARFIGRSSPKSREREKGRGDDGSPSSILFVEESWQVWDAVIVMIRSSRKRKLAFIEWDLIGEWTVDVNSRDIRSWSLWCIVLHPVLAVDLRVRNVSVIQLKTRSVCVCEAKRWPLSTEAYLIEFEILKFFLLFTRERFIFVCYGANFQFIFDIKMTIKVN